MKFDERILKISQIQLDLKNPRFPAVSNQREAISAMLSDTHGEKIINLAQDIYQFGLNPSAKLIVFKEDGNYVDGDGNRRLTALKLLETPSLADNFPKLRRKLDQILKRAGVIPTETGCVIFAERKAAQHWIAINHGGEQEGRGQTPWNPEQKERFDGNRSVGLQALDILSHKKLINDEDKSKINKSTLDRLLSFKDVRSKIAVQKTGDKFTFGDIKSLHKTVIALKGQTVDEVYTAKKGKQFINNVISPPGGQAAGSTDGNNPQATAPDVSEVRSRRVRAAGLLVFGGTLPLKPGHVNNLYRDIEAVYNFHLDNRKKLSDDFIVIFRMALRLLAETAAKESSTTLQAYLTSNFDSAKAQLDQNQRTSLSSQSVTKEKVVQLFQTGAHDYTNSRNEEQALAMSVILGGMLKQTHLRST